MPYTLKDKVALTFLTQALNSRYLISIREEKGGTYGVQRSRVRPKYIPRRDLQAWTISLRHQRGDGRRAARDRDEGDPRRSPRTAPRARTSRRHREFMLKSWKNSLEQNAGMDELHPGQIRSRDLNYLARSRAGDPRRSPTPTCRPSPRRSSRDRQPREGRHAPREGKGRITDLSNPTEQGSRRNGCLFYLSARLKMH